VCGDLIGAANEAGGNDNTTVVVATVGARRKTPAVIQPSASDQDTQEVTITSPWWKRVVTAILRRR
jgi:hypothetical protein